MMESCKCKGQTDFTDRLVSRIELAQILGSTPAGIAMLEQRHNLPLRRVMLGRLVKYSLREVMAFVSGEGAKQ